MTTRLRQRVTRPVISHDDSGSMLLALFAIVILTSLVTVVLMVTISQQAKTRKATDFTFAGQAADTAVNDALIKANSGVLSSISSASGTGVTGDFRWDWSSPSNQFTPLTREITATGCRKSAASSVCTPNSTRKIKATLSGVAYESPDNSTEVAYVLSPAGSFNRALFADQELIMQDSSKVMSYSSATIQQDTGFGQVATNGIADFGPNVDLDGIFMLNTQAYRNNGRCNGKVLGIVLSQCDPLRTPRLIHEIGPKLKVSSTQFITDQIATAPCVQPLTAWVATRAGGLLPSGVQCYSSMNFDMTTTVPFGGTAKVYVTGPITIAPGLKINNPLGSVTPAAATLQIFSSGPVVSLGGAASATQTEVAWALWAPNAVCASNNPTGPVTVYGAMVCQKIFTQGVFIAKWDEALLTLAAGSSTVWDVSAYRDGS